jgi:multicomponent K+:H+ antiporter subunit D
MDYMYVMARNLHAPAIEIGNILATPLVVEASP